MNHGTAGPWSLVSLKMGKRHGSMIVDCGFSGQTYGNLLSVTFHYSIFSALWTKACKGYHSKEYGILLVFSVLDLMSTVLFY